MFSTRNATQIISIWMVILAGTHCAVAGTREEWSSILHSEDSVDQERSAEFYLTSERNLWGEYYELSTRLADPNLGLKTACTFPARYLFLKSQISLPEYNLAQCDDLMQFVGSFQKRHLSLVLTTEYLNAPASAFGHLMLVFHDSEVPTLDSDAVHFAAVVDREDSFFKYVRRGLFGGYTGVYIRDPLFKKIHEYSVVEQRFMIFYRLNLHESRVVRLIYHLYELRKAKFRYYFSDENCAYHMGRLLEIGTGIPFQKSALYTLPVEIIYDFRPAILEKRVVSPLALDLNSQLRDLSEVEMGDFREIVRGGELRERELTERTKWALYSYSLLAFKKSKEVLENHSQISRMNFVSTLPFTPSIQENYPDPTVRPKPRRVSVSFLRGDDSGNGVAFHLRPLLTDIRDLQIGSTAESELSLLDTKIVFLNRWSIDRAKIMSLKVFGKHNEFVRAFTWSANLGLNRENKIQKLSSNLEIGMGRSLALGTSTLSGLANIGFDANGEWVGPYFAPGLSLFAYVAKETKLGMESRVKFSKVNTYYQVEPFFAGEYFLPLSVFISGRVSNTIQDSLRVEGGISLYF